MSRSKATVALDLSTWAEFDSNALTADQQKVFAARRCALELYVANTAIEIIEKQTGVDRRQLYRLLSRCTRIHEDGRIFGYRALAPYARVADYQRLKRAKLHPVGGSRGTAGAFDKLLQLNPSLSVWIDQQIHNKRIAIDQLHSEGGLRTRLRGLKHLHSGFLRECRLLGLTAADYPLNTELLGIRSLAAVTKVRGLQHFARGARLAGATHLKGMPAPKEAFVPAASHAFDVVEFDGHRLDVRLKVVVRDPLGFEQEFEIERIWLLVIIDVWSRAVLGYHVSLNREYSGYDVIRTIEAALEPHRARTFTLPGLATVLWVASPQARCPNSVMRRGSGSSSITPRRTWLRMSVTLWRNSWDASWTRGLRTRQMTAPTLNVSLARLPAVSQVACPATPAPVPVMSAGPWPIPKVICACMSALMKSKSCSKPRLPLTTPHPTTA